MNILGNDRDRPRKNLKINSSKVMCTKGQMPEMYHCSNSGGQYLHKKLKKHTKYNVLFLIIVMSLRKRWVEVLLNWI